MNLKLSAAQGRVLQNFPPRFEVAEGAQAEVTIEGSVGYLPVTFVGLKTNAGFTLELKTAEGWKVIDQSKFGNDWWQADYDLTAQTWSLTFSLPLDELGTSAHTLRLRAK
jgi:hypothetical protein